jgi:thioredoxin-like negative regulator of GroEL
LLEMDDDSLVAAELSPLLEESNDSLLSIYASQVLLESGETGRAVEILENRLSKDPNNNEIKIRLAGSYLSVGRADDARSLAEEIPD